MLLHQKKGMGVYDIFSSNDLAWLFYSIYLCFILNLRRDGSFLLGDFTFFISKRLYHTSYIMQVSYRLNIINFGKGFSTWSPSEPSERLTVPPRPPVAFYFPIHAYRLAIHVSLFIYIYIYNNYIYPHNLICLFILKCQKI